jgi:hypothetical protein
MLVDAVPNGPEFFCYLSECWSQKGSLLPVLMYHILRFEVCCIRVGACCLSAAHVSTSSRTTYKMKASEDDSVQQLHCGSSVVSI